MNNLNSRWEESGHHKKTARKNRMNIQKTGNKNQMLKKASILLKKNFAAAVAAVFILNLLVYAAVDSAVFASGCQQLYDGVLRLHILANSDSDEDQQLKLKVRDCVLQKAHELGLGQNCEDMQSICAQAQKLLPQLVQSAQEELLHCGSTQRVTACLTKMYFDTREYEDFTMPAGEYQAVRFVIGEGKGHNWWCVLFPQMCLPLAFQEEPDVSFSDTELRVLSARPQYEPRFALLELWHNIVSF